jgi:predicted metal-binding membrane protein
VRVLRNRTLSTEDAKFYLCAGSVFLAGTIAIYRESVGHGGMGALCSTLRLQGGGLSVWAATESVALFLAMWCLMMVAMMMPVLIPVLVGWRRQSEAPRARINALTLGVGMGYFIIWWSSGLLGYLATALANSFRGEPVFNSFMQGLILIAAGVFQSSRYKVVGLMRCRRAANEALPVTLCAAVVRGLSLGVACLISCANFVVVLLAVGLMNMTAMLLLTVAAILERATFTPLWVTRVIGLVLVLIGVSMVTRVGNPLGQ